MQTFTIRSRSTSISTPLLYVDPDGHQGILDKAIEYGKQVVADTVNGAAKTAYNAVISGPNTVNTIIDAGLSLTGTKFRFGTYQYAQAETPGEKGSMLAVRLFFFTSALKERHHVPRPKRHPELQRQKVRPQRPQRHQLQRHGRIDGPPALQRRSSAHRSKVNPAWNAVRPHREWWPTTGPHL